MLLPPRGRRRACPICWTRRASSSSAPPSAGRARSPVQAPPPQQVGDKHFSFLHRAEVVQGDAVFTSRFGASQRRGCCRLTSMATASAFSRARAGLRPQRAPRAGGPQGPGAQYDAIRQARLARVPPWAQAAMACGDVLVANEVLRSYDSLLLERIGPSGPLRPAC